MLTEKRFEEIVNLVNEKGNVTVQELKDIFQISESTIRRDLTVLHENGKLIKVFGGAIALENSIFTRDIRVDERKQLNREEKIKIAQYAASLIREDDFVYIDAGTTTEYMIPYIDKLQATFVTNGVSHAQRLAAAGLHVILIGGELKESTEAVVGSTAIVNVQKYHFTKGFWGTNGISRKSGFTTPDFDEAMVKQVSMENTSQRYILCDSSKFNQESAVTFANLESAIIITDKAEDPQIKKWNNIIVP